MNENKRMYSFYVKTCKKCEFFLSVGNTTGCFYEKHYWQVTDSQVGPKFFLNFFPKTLERCPYFNKNTRSHIEQSESKPEKYQNICDIIYKLLLFFGWIIMPLGFTYSPYTGFLSIVIYVVTVLGFHFWGVKKGYIKLPTEEEIEENKEIRIMEREAQKQASMERWSAPIKSAHIIRMERGLRTGLGNRRPYPHGRRTKKD